MDLSAAMETNNQRLRKACDLCYTRKFKCNGQQPRCSNCMVYATNCTHTAQSRKSKPKTRRNGGNKERNTDEVQSLQARVRELEAQLPNMSSLTEGHIRDHTHQSAENDSIGGRSLSLPPLQQALPMIEMFLNNLNSVLPLFQASEFLRLVGECYSCTPRQRDPVAWAAINVALALVTLQIPPSAGDNDAVSQKARAFEYLNRAQSVISAVMLSETRLLNIQTMVGMVMVLQSARDPTEALILIAATLRLAHKMGLQNRASSAHLNPEERRQHAYVFWLVYILEKDLSLRAQQPSLQPDDDIDLDLPHFLPTDNDDDDDGSAAGVIITADGNARMNYFLARVQLANIQGGVYNCIYSTRAALHSPEERVAAANSIRGALEKWQAEIPPEFGAAVVASMTKDNPANIDFFCVLHSITLQCMTLVNRAHAWNEQWVSSVRRTGEGMGMLQLPPGWEALVHQARDFMVLFEQAWSPEIWFRWVASCPYISSMVILVVNILLDLQHDRAQLDSQLVDTALQWLNNTAKEMQKEDVRGLRDVCVGIVRVVKRKLDVASTMAREGGLFSNLLFE